MPATRRRWRSQPLQSPCPSCSRMRGEASPSKVAWTPQRCARAESSWLKLESTTKQARSRALSKSCFGLISFEMRCTGFGKAILSPPNSGNTLSLALTARLVCDNVPAASRHTCFFAAPPGLPLLPLALRLLLLPASASSSRASILAHEATSPASLLSSI